MPREIFISVDIESSGPNPSTYSMLSLGACLVEDTSEVFYMELKPTSKLFVPEALAVCELSLADLERDGEHPEVGMRRFDKWVQEVSEGGRPVFTAFNASFDWMFVQDYFQQFVGHNPFGISALDIKAYYMGKFGTSHSETTKARLDKRFKPESPHTHNALDDAIEQALLFKNILDYPGNKL